MWFVFGTLSAIFDTARISFTKKVSHRSGDHDHPYLTSLANFIYFTPGAFLVLFLTSWQPLTTLVLVALTASAAMYVFATVLTTKAADCCDLSSSIPFLSFAPLFITFTSTVLLHEIPTILALVGIGLVVAGSYLIHFDWKDVKNKRWLASFHRLRADRGAQYIFVVAVLFGFIGTFNRYVVENTGVLTFISLWLILTSFFAFLLVSFRQPEKLKHLTRWRRLLPINLTYLGMTTMDALGLSVAIAPLVFAVKRVEILFSVLVGAIFYQEHHISERLLGTLVILTGLILILIG